MVTVAPASAAPVPSSTVPETDPYSWPKSERVERRKKNASAIHDGMRLLLFEVKGFNAVGIPILPLSVVNKVFECRFIFLHL